MDAVVVIILLGEAASCLLLLHFEGLLRKPAHVLTAAFLTAAAFLLRYFCLPHETLDYTTFLAGWVQFFRNHGGFSALSQSVGNYNVPYLYFLAAFSYSSVSDLYLIKLLSVFFDIVLAWASMRLIGRFTKGLAEDPRLFRRAPVADRPSERRVLGAVRQHLCGFRRAVRLPRAG
jgi:hypothetical protein